MKVEGNGNCLYAAVKKSLLVRHSGLGGAMDKGRKLLYYPNHYFR